MAQVELEVWLAHLHEMLIALEYPYDLVEYPICQIAISMEGTC